MMSELYCVNLDKGVRVDNKGTCTSCCLQMIPYKDDLGNELNIRKNTLEEAINSRTANIIRENLKKGGVNLTPQQRSEAIRKMLTDEGYGDYLK